MRRHPSGSAHSAVPSPLPLIRHPRRPTVLFWLLASTALGLPGAALAQVVNGPVVNAGAVNASGGDLSEAPVPGANTPPTQQQLFQSGETTRVLDQLQLEQVGPVGGGAQAIGVAPGAQVVGYGASGATKYTVQLDGLANGWGGFGGYTGNNNLMMTFDGVPMNNVATGLWASATIPQIGMIQNINVTYGPGDAASRWYDSTGGTIEFTPIQPTQKAGADLYLTYGSYNQQNLNFDIRTGSIDGWSSVIAGGFNEGNDFRQSPNGFTWPSEDYAIYTKTIKNFSDGDFSFGGYIAQGAGYRPNVIPLTPTKGIGLYGANTLPLYSEATNFYEALSSDVWAKFDMDQFATVYSKQNIHLDDYNTLHNMVWYVDEQRLHSDFVNYTPNYNQMYEYNNPENWDFGDKLWMTTTLPYNTLDYGGYYIYSYYQTMNSFWNPYPPYFGSRFEPNGHYRNGLFYNQDVALFIQDDIHPFPSLHITPSLRVVNDAIQFANGTGPYGAFPNATGTDQDQFGSQHANYVGVEPGVNINYAPLTWLAFYGGYEQAYQTPTVGGGGGYFQAIPVTQNSTALELAEYYQAGTKIHFDDALDGYLRKFLLDVNWFDLRLAKQVANTTFFNGTEATTFGTSDYRGVNIALDDNVFSTVHLFFNGAVMNAIYQSFYNGTSFFNGSHVPYVPDVTIDAGLEYTYNIGQNVVKPKVWWQYTGEQYFFNNATVAPSNTTMAAYNTLNLAIDAQVPFEVAGYGKKLDFSLALLNVTNNKFNIYEYESAGGYFSNGSPVALGYPGAPLTVFGTVGISF